MSRPGLFRDPLLTLKSEFSGRFTVFEDGKWILPGALRAPEKPFGIISESASRAETSETGVHVQLQLFWPR